jgi:hypothetical protein
MKALSRAGRRARTAVRSVKVYAPREFFDFQLSEGVIFGIELGQRKIKSSSAPYISAPCVLNVFNCEFTSRFKALLDPVVPTAMVRIGNHKTEAALSMLVHKALQL